MTGRLRKKWATSFPDVPGDQRQRHPSKPAVYRWLKNEAALVGGSRGPHVTIWVDEGLGAGWELFERIDLREVHQ